MRIQNWSPHKEELLRVGLLKEDYHEICSCIFSNIILTHHMLNYFRIWSSFPEDVWVCKNSSVSFMYEYTVRSQVLWCHWRCRVNPWCQWHRGIKLSGVIDTSKSNIGYLILESFSSIKKNSWNFRHYFYDYNSISGLTHLYEEAQTSGILSSIFKLNKLVLRGVSF